METLNLENPPTNDQSALRGDEKSPSQKRVKCSYERPLCSGCQKKPADIVEEGVNLCGNCYAAYHNIKTKPLIQREKGEV